MREKSSIDKTVQNLQKQTQPNETSSKKPTRETFRRTSHPIKQIVSDN